MKDDRIKYLKGTKELLRLAEEGYEDFLFEQSLSGFSKPIKFKNRYRKSWSEGEDDHVHRRKFSAMKQGLNKN
ncbi:MAG: hypothetical protein ACI9UO_001776 [Nitrospinales bacterium]|jgi:hypothetical protein